VKQRDNEIGILLNYLNKVKEKNNGSEPIPVTRAEEAPSAKKEEKKGLDSGGPTLF